MWKCCVKSEVNGVVRLVEKGLGVICQRKSAGCGELFQRETL